VLVLDARGNTKWANAACSGERGTLMVALAATPLPVMVVLRRPKESKRREGAIMGAIIDLLIDLGCPDFADGPAVVPTVAEMVLFRYHAVDPITTSACSAHDPAWTVSTVARKSVVPLPRPLPKLRGV
jgi:hypothetical protein